MTGTEWDRQMYEGGRDLLRRVLRDPFRFMGLRFSKPTPADLESFRDGFSAAVDDLLQEFDDDCDRAMHEEETT